MTKMSTFNKVAIIGRLESFPPEILLNNLECEVREFSNLRLLVDPSNYHLIIFHYEPNCRHDMAALLQIRKRYPYLPIILTIAKEDSLITKWSLRAKMSDCIILPDELQHFRFTLETLFEKKNQTALNDSVVMPLNESTEKLTQARKITPAIQYIADNYSQKVSVNQLASICNMSASNFSLWFKKSTGFSLRAYMNKYRISMAKTLLLESDLNIKEISQQLGFSDISHFIRRFKSVEKMTPHKYRNLMYSRNGLSALDGNRR